MRRPKHLIAAAALTCASAASAFALPIQAVSIQPIQVCNDVGGDCAAINIPLAVINAIYAQADVVVGLAPTLQLNNTAFQIVDTVANSASPTDEARQLMRGPQLNALGLSPQSTTINVFFVKDIREVDTSGALTAIGAGLTGLGFINSNGIIVDQTARLDTLAHELGHNFGLPHIAVPTNLMADGSTRAILTGIADVAPAGPYAQLNAAQIVEIRNPLFTVNLARVAASGPDSSSDLLDCTLSGLHNCLTFDFQNSPNGDKLRRVKLNFLPGTDVAGASATGATASLTFASLGDGTRAVLADGTVELTFDFSTQPGGGITAGQFFRFHADYTRGCFINVPACFDFPSEFPLSVFFEFDSGVGTTGLFDIANGGGSSDDPILVTFAAAAPANSDVPLNLELSDGEVAVPVPATAALFVAALTLGAVLRRR